MAPIDPESQVKSLLAALLAAASFLAQATVTPLAGVTPQQATALSPFPTPVAVRVTDESGRPVAGAAAYFAQGGVMQVAPGAGGDCYIDFMIILVCRASTDAEGIARFPAMRAAHATTFTASVSATNDLYPGTIRYGEATLQFTALPIQAPARLAIAAGDNQRVAIGTPLAPITVRIESAQGQPVRQALVWYAPYGSGAGSFQLPPSGGPAEIRTDDRGLATLPTFTAGWGLGEHEAQVRHFDDAAAVHLIATLKYSATNAQGGTTLELGDLWWGGSSESGWGLSIAQRGDRLFNVWFVYDDSTRPTWFVQPGGQWTGGTGDSYGNAIYWPRSAPWFAYDASRFAVGPKVGSGSLNFNGPQAAWASFSTSVGDTTRLWNKRIERMFFGGSEPGPLPGVGGLWWGGPSQDGWGIAIHEQGSKLFLVWFTYDGDGMPTWFVMPDGAWSADRTHAGTVYRASGPPWTLQAPFDAASVRVTAVGSYRLRFDSRDAARLEVDVEGRSVSLPLIRHEF